MLKNCVKICLFLFFAFCSIQLFAVNKDYFFESDTVREYSFTLLPIKEYYCNDEKIKSIIVSGYDNDLVENKTIQMDPNTYEFNRNGRIELLSIISDSVAETRYEYFYNEEGFLIKRLEQQYTYNQLYKEKVVIVLRLQDRDDEIRIVQKKLQADEKISTEEIRQKEDRLIYKYNDGGYEKVYVYIFNNEGLLITIERSSKYLRLKNQKTHYSTTVISYDDEDRIIEYRVFDDNKETINYYSFEYGATSKLEKVIETDYDQEGQYKRIYNFITYDTKGNWVEMREDVYSWGKKVVEYYIDRQIEYWD